MTSTRYAVSLSGRTRCQLNFAQYCAVVLINGQMYGIVGVEADQLKYAVENLLHKHVEYAQFIYLTALFIVCAANKVSKCQVRKNIVRCRTSVVKPQWRHLTINQRACNDFVIAVPMLCKLALISCSNPVCRFFFPSFFIFCTYSVSCSASQ